MPSYVILAGSPPPNLISLQGDLFTPPVFSNCHMSLLCGTLCRRCSYPSTHNPPVILVLEKHQSVLCNDSVSLPKCLVHLIVFLNALLVVPVSDTGLSFWVSLLSTLTNWQHICSFSLSVATVPHFGAFTAVSYPLCLVFAIL